MILPEQLTELPFPIMTLISELNDRIIEDIALRMARTGRMTDTQDYQLMRLREIAAFDIDTRDLVGRFVERSLADVDDMFANAARMTVANDTRFSGVVGVPYERNIYLQQLTWQVANQTGGTFRNMTNTLALLDRQTGRALLLRDTLITAFDRMELSVSSGLESYDMAIRRTVNELSASGLRNRQEFYTNARGNRVFTSVDVVARRALFGGLKQMSHAQANRNAALMGTDVFQITWHSGHRASHGWGGRRYSESGNHGLPTRDELFSAYGGGSLDDYGCRHDIVAIDPETPLLYTDDELAELERRELETVAFDGREYNRAEQNDRMRKYERDIRDIRRQQTVAKTLMENASEADRERLEREYYALKNRNNNMMREYERFAAVMGLPVEKERIYYDGRGRLGGVVPQRYLTNVANSSKMVAGGGRMDFTGASGAIPRNDTNRMDAHAERYYEEIRKRTSDIEAIANNTNFTIDEIRAIKNHVFITEHDLGAEIPQRFIPDYDMAISWQRLIDGKNIHEMDIVLLNHELHELRLMKQGISYDIAHRNTEETYNYTKYSRELDAREGIK
jgi:hypothetical protein